MMNTADCEHARSAGIRFARDPFCLGGVVLNVLPVALWGDEQQERRNVDQFLWSHWCQHAPPALMTSCGFTVPAPRCGELRCRLLAVALAVTEIDAHEFEMKRRADLLWLEQASDKDCLSRPTRESLRMVAHQLSGDPISRAVDNRTGGHPVHILANAVAQQLSSGGFSHREIGVFMAATAEVIRKRCAAPDARSLGAYVHVPRVGPVAMVRSRHVSGPR